MSELQDPQGTALRILCVDDDIGTLNMYKLILASNGAAADPVETMSELAELVGESSADQAGQPNFQVEFCHQSQEAVLAVEESLARGRPFAVAFIDIRLPPGPDGVWAAEQIRIRDPHVEIVMVSGFSDLNPSEISRQVPPRHKLLYLQKPFHVPEILQLAMALCAKWTTERLALRIYRNQSELVSRQTQDLQKANEALRGSIEELHKTFGSVVKVLTAVVETRDPYTAGHQSRVADLARAMATQLGLPHEQIEGIRIAGIIHDIGKISIPAEILSKPGKLTEIEFSLIKSHAQTGYSLLKPIDFPWPVAEIVHQHHERCNGTGYPQGLATDQILQEARIMAVADTVEAMASHRPYRAALGIQKALEEIERLAGVQYDAQAVASCLDLFRNRGYSFKLPEPEPR
jgi:putative nucleotidyltransferase with HDIG domain